MATHEAEGTRVVRAVLLDGFGRIAEGVREVVAGLAPDDLSWRPKGADNSIGWLLWHLCRQQDAQLSSIAGEEEAWTAGGWVDRFDLSYAREEMGYGQDAGEARAFRVEDPQLLTRYAEAVHDISRRLVERLDAEDYDVVIDTSWDPPVTVGVRVYSVLEDSAKHLGQAEYLKGMLPRR